MAKLNKWLESITPSANRHDVLQAALSARLKGVTFYLKQIKKEEYPSAETVHQLRVWARRAKAVVDLFRPADTAEAWDKLAHLLRNYRRLAGPLRDFDVLLERLQEAEPAIEPAVLEQVELAHAEVLEDFAAMAKRKKIFRRGKAVLKKRKREVLQAAGTSATSFQHDLISRLRTLIVTFFECGLGKLKEPEALHAFRIAVKELKYALELSAGVLERTKVEVAHARLNDLQEKLGAICDYQNALVRYEVLAESLTEPNEKESLEQVINSDRKELQKARDDFGSYWNTAERERWTHQLQDLIAQAAEVPDEQDDDSSDESMTNAPRLPLDDPDDLEEWDRAKEMPGEGEPEADEELATDSEAVIPRRKRERSAARQARPQRRKQVVASPKSPAAKPHVAKLPSQPLPKKRRKKAPSEQTATKRLANKKSVPQPVQKKKRTPARPTTDTNKPTESRKSAPKKSTAANRRVPRRPSRRPGSRRG